MKRWIPRPYQPIMTRFILDHPRCALLIPMGFGKSSATLAALDVLLIASLVTRILVIAPLRVARNTWPQEIRTWSNFAHLTVAAAVGTLTERRAALKRGADITTIHYEQIPWLVEEYGAEWPFDCVVADELTKLKSFRTRQGGKRAAALAKVIHTKVKRFIGLTGTPAPNGLLDLWGQVFFIDEGLRLGRTYSAFERRWFRALPNGGNVQWQKLEPVAHAQAEIEAKLHDVCLALDPKEWFDLEAPIVNTIYVELPLPARKHYREMEKLLFTQLGEHGVEAFGAAAKTIKCLQLASGFGYVGESNTEWAVTHDEKLDALESVIEEAAGMPVLVAYHFIADLKRLQDRFPQARVLDAHGKTVDDWNAGKIPILLAHPASAGHGLNLQHGGNILAFMGANWNLEEHLQIIERIGPVRQRQSGYDRPVYVHYILARDTIDDLVMTRLHSKRSVQDILLEALKRRDRLLEAA